MPTLNEIVKSLIESIKEGFLECAQADRSLYSSSRSMVDDHVKYCSDEFNYFWSWLSGQNVEILDKLEQSDLTGLEEVLEYELFLMNQNVLNEDLDGFGEGLVKVIRLTESRVLQVNLKEV